MINLKSQINSMSSRNLNALAEELGMPNPWECSKAQVMQAVNANPKFQSSIDLDSLDKVMRHLSEAQVWELNQQLEARGLPAIFRGGLFIGNFSLRAEPSVEFKAHGPQIKCVSLLFKVNQGEDRKLFDQVWSKVRGASRGANFSKVVGNAQVNFRVPDIHL